MLRCKNVWNVQRWLPTPAGSIRVEEKQQPWKKPVEKNVEARLCLRTGTFLRMTPPCSVTAPRPSPGCRARSPGDAHRSDPVPRGNAVVLSTRVFVLTWIEPVTGWSIPKEIFPISGVRSDECDERVNRSDNFCKFFFVDCLPSCGCVWQTILMRLWPCWHPRFTHTSFFFIANKTQTHTSVI